MELHIYSVKAKSQAGNVWVKDIMTAARDCKNLHILPENAARESATGVNIYLWEYTQKWGSAHPCKL